MENLKVVKYSSIEDIEKHICINSITDISSLKEFIQSKTNDKDAKLHWKRDNFKFQSILHTGSCPI